MGEDKDYASRPCPLFSTRHWEQPATLSSFLPSERCLATLGQGLESCHGKVTGPFSGSYKGEAHGPGQDAGRQGG